MNTSLTYNGAPTTALLAWAAERSVVHPSFGGTNMKGVTALLGASVLALVMSSGAWAGSGADVTPAQISAAKTAADHEAIATAYEAEAVALDKKSEMHQQMADTYKLGNKPVFIGPTKHCAALAKEFKAAAAENRALAAEHHQLAQSAAK